MNEPKISAGIRPLIWVPCLLLFLVVFVGLIFLLSFSLFGGASQVEVARAGSSDGAIDAVLIETNGGATSGFGYRVQLVPKGGAAGDDQAASLYAARRSDCAYGVNLRWAGPSRLIIEYEQAQQAETSPAVVEGKTIAVELTPGVTDPSAPCGGMEYNLRGRPRG